VPTRLNRSRCHSGRGLGWAQGTMYWEADPREGAILGVALARVHSSKLADNFVLGERSIAISSSVCLSVCASVSSSPVLRVRRSSNVCECHVCPSAARSSSVSFAICYVLPVRGRRRVHTQCAVRCQRRSRVGRAPSYGHR